MRRDQGRATTVNAALPGRGPPASSAVRGLAHRLHGAAQEPHAERRRLGGHRDARPCEVLDAAVLGVRRAAGPRARLPGTRRRPGGPPRGGRGTLGFGCAASRLLPARFRVGAARRSGPPASPRRGLRTPGRAAGRLPNTPPCSSASSRVSGLGGVCSWSAIQRVFHRARRTHAPAPELRNSGPPSVFLGEHPALGPASACARISAASRFSRLATAETLDFRKYSGYDSNRRLRALGLGMDIPARACADRPRSAFLSQCRASRRSAGRARLPECRPGARYGDEGRTRR